MTFLEATGKSIETRLEDREKQLGLVMKTNADYKDRIDRL